MDHVPEIVEFNHRFDIILAGFFASLIGAQTTLELISRRTHIKGAYNWFLLVAASFTMGGVAVWAMHFIGNNGLRLNVRGEEVMLSYKSGYAFVSLVITCFFMFITFAFIGITEEAQVNRIMSCSVFGGMGIVCSHFLGQFSIDYFILRYHWLFILAAVVTACTSLTTALFIFLKLRERWINTWQRRFFSSLLIAAGITVVHFLIVQGTTFITPNTDELPKDPQIAVPEVIATVTIIVVACLAVLSVIIVTALIRAFSRYNRNNKKRLVLDALIFDSMGRILVKVDGTLPMKEIARDLELNETKQKFSVNHPLFSRLFDSSINKPATNNNYPIIRTGADMSSYTIEETYNIIEARYVAAMKGLRRELQIPDESEIGVLSDIVITTDTISDTNVFAKKAPLFEHPNNSKCAVNQGSRSKKKRFYKSQKREEPRNCDDIEMGMPSTVKNDHGDIDLSTSSSHNRRNSAHDDERLSWILKNSYIDEDTVIASGEIASRQFSTDQTTLDASGSGVNSSDETFPNEESRSVMERLSIEDYDSEDKHIFLVNKIHDDMETSRLLSQGYRFAEAVFISKTMAAKLRIPADYMRHYLNDMHRMADSICALTQKNWNPSPEVSAPDPAIFNGCTRPSVLVGSFVLLDESRLLNNTHILVNKSKIFSFPVEEVKYEEDGYLTQISKKEAQFIKCLEGKSLFEIAALQQTLRGMRITNENLPSYGFIKALESASKLLLDSTSYNKGLFQESRLHAKIIELPPFTLSTGKCQLILFKSFVNTAGITAAINHTFQEPIKCIPLNLYLSLSGYLTDKAAYIYQMNNDGRLHSNYYMQQKYFRQAETNMRGLSIDTHPDNFIRSYSPSYENATETDDSFIHMDPLGTSPTSLTSPSLFAVNPASSNFSLPPPPRVKRYKSRAGNSIDMTSPIIKEPSLDVTMVNTPLLKIYPRKERFRWMDSIVDELLH